MIKTNNDVTGFDSSSRKVTRGRVIETIAVSLNNSNDNNNNHSCYY